jgi:SAM-dependent methyltransferase
MLVKPSRPSLTPDDLVGATWFVTADVSEPSVARRANGSRLPACGTRRPSVADASIHPFAPDSFELAFSRFGIMSFSDPVAAFENARRAMKPGGRLALAVFRAASETLWRNAALESVRYLLPPIPTPGPEEPGPFSWADPARVHRILEGAGFSEVSLTPLDPEIQLAGPKRRSRGGRLRHGDGRTDAGAP